MSGRCDTSGQERTATRRRVLRVSARATALAVFGAAALAVVPVVGVLGSGASPAAAGPLLTFTSPPPGGTSGAPGPSSTTGSPIPTDPPVTTTPGSGPTDPGKLLLAVGFDDGGQHGLTGYPAWVPVAVSPIGEGSHRALTVTPAAYVQGAELTLPASTFPYGTYTATARVRLLRGTAQDMRVTVVGARNEHQVVRRAARSGWTDAVTAFDRFDAARPVTLRIEPIRVCGDAPAAPVAFELLNLTIMSETYWSGPRVQSVPGCPVTAPATPVPTPNPYDPPLCRARYSLVASWPGGYLAQLRLTATSRPVLGWRASWYVPAGQTVTSVFPGTDLLPWGGDSTGPLALYLEHPPDQPDVMPGHSVTLEITGRTPGTGNVTGVRLGDYDCAVDAG